MRYTIELTPIDPNFTKVSIEGIQYYFSGSALIGIITRKGQVICCRNTWGSTIGKYLARIDGGGMRAVMDRLDYIDFMDAVKRAQDENF